MSTRKIKTINVTDATPSDHLGRLGEITYRDGYLYYHDGVTAGGELINGGGSGGGGPTTWTSITGKPSFATVATSGSYADLTGKPTIPTSFSSLVNSENTFSLNGAGLLTFPNGTTSEGNSITIPVDESLTVNLSTGQPLELNSTFKINPESIKLPTANGVICSGEETAASSWALDSGNKTFYFPDAGDGVMPRISYSTYNNIGMELRTYAKGVRISTQDGANESNWTFGATGTLTIPGTITLPNGAVIRDTAGKSVAFGEGAGLTSQGNYAVAVGYGAGYANQGGAAVAIGEYAGTTTQGTQAVAIGINAGVTTQGNNSVAIGPGAGASTQGTEAVAIGTGAGETTQGNSAVAVGYNAGLTSQGLYTVAIGNSAGQTSQGPESIAIGSTAGQTTQGSFCVAVGLNAGRTTQGSTAVALGYNAGLTSQGQSAVAIGYFAGYTNQAANTIILNATGSAVNGVAAQTDSFYVAPIRSATATANVLYYNTTTKEVTYGAGDSGSYAPAVTANWSNPAPTTIAEALDRIAARLLTLGGDLP